MKGRFITLEGVEGCGKSTQLALLRDWLESQNYPVVVTREPGGTPISEDIRRILLDPGNTVLCPVAELLLYEAARAQLVAEFIRPALAEGAVVLCDRFADSTTAYQGAGRSLDYDTVIQLHRVATQGVWPDLTIVLDMPPEEGLRRAADTGEPDRMEQEPLDFHNQVRREFQLIAEREPERVRLVDGLRGIEDVAEEIRQAVALILEKP